MRLATPWRFPRLTRPGRRGLAELGLLAAVLAGLGWIAWRTSLDPWPARATLATLRSTRPLGFSPDGETFLNADWDARGVTVTPWDLASASGRGAWPTWPVKSAGPPVAWLAPDGRAIAAVVMDHLSPATVLIADAATGEIRASFATDHPRVYQLSWSPDSATLRACLGSPFRIGEVATWDAATGRKTSGRKLAVPMWSNLAGISPDGRTIALSPGTGQGVDLWDLEGDKSLGPLASPAPADPDFVSYPGFSADGKTLALGRGDGTVEIWDVAGRRLRKSIPVHSPGGAAMASVKVAPDGRTFASTSWGRPDLSTFGRIWRDAGTFLAGPAREAEAELAVVDIATGRTLARAPTTSMPPIYSPDGRMIATHEGSLGLKLRDVPPSPR